MQPFQEFYGWSNSNLHKSLLLLYPSVSIVHYVNRENFAKYDCEFAVQAKGESCNLRIRILHSFSPDWHIFFQHKCKLHESWKWQEGDEVLSVQVSKKIVFTNSQNEKKSYRQDFIQNFTYFIQKPINVEHSRILRIIYSTRIIIVRLTIYITAI